MRLQLPFQTEMEPRPNEIESRLKLFLSSFSKYVFSNVYRQEEKKISNHTNEGKVHLFNHLNSVFI